MQDINEFLANKTPTELAERLKRDGYHAEAECIHALYAMLIASVVENLRLRNVDIGSKEHTH